MAKKKNSLLPILLIFLVVEFILVILSGGLTHNHNIGYVDGKLVVETIENPDLQEKIMEDFQPDEHLKVSGHTGKLYNSEKLYNFFKTVFGEAHAISAFQLIRMLLIIDILLLVIAFLLKRNLFDRPSKPQVIFEMIYETFEGLVRDTLGNEKLHYTPYILTLFLFIWICNMAGLVPIPGIIEPTRNLNVPLGLGLMAVVIVHYSAFKAKGLWGHAEDYLNPVKNPLFILDIVGEISKAVSISFRLFGNVLGGAIIILVVSSLVKFIVFPVGLNLFFGLFVGTIQAFVFTMLALTYIGVEIAE